jgi:hypothetical protein
MRNLLHKYSNLNNQWLFIGTAVIIKLAILIYIITLAHNWHTIVLEPDDGSYFSPVENFLHHHGYCYIPSVPFAGRMPGYSLIYLLFRLLLSPAASVIAIVGLQFILSSLAAYILCLSINKIFQNTRIAVIAFFLYSFSTFIGVFDLYIAGESLSNSAFIFMLYYLLRALKEDKNKSQNMFVSGLFLTWAIFLRPYIGLFLLLFPFLIIYQLYGTYTKAITKLFLQVTLLCLPFTVCEVGWTVRNYVVTHRLILLEDNMAMAYGNTYSDSWLAVDNLVYTWGEDAANFDEGSLGSYFRHPSDPTPYAYPNRIFKNVTTYNNDSLLHLRALYGRTLDLKDTVEYNKLTADILRLCAIYKNDYINHNYLSYMTYRPVTSLKRLIIPGGYRYIQFKNGTNSLLKKTTKLLSTLYYFIILLLSCIGVLLCLTKRIAFSYTLFFTVLIFTLILTIILYSEIQEPRYFLHIYSILVMYAAFGINKLLKGNNGPLNPQLP